MPNWCTGDLKVRGTKKQIVNFIENELVIPRGSINITIYGKPVIEREWWGLEIDVGDRGLWFKNARMFFEYDIYINTDTEDGPAKDDTLLTIDLGELQSAWTINTNVLTELSKKYNLDFKIYAYESGMRFNLDYEVHSGEVIRNNEIYFKDYIWECPQPRLGG